MNEDALLLRRYAEEGCEEAFTGLVEKHVTLVYNTALRRTGNDVHRAADVAQEVFVALARQARTLANHPVLAAWLHTATRNIAIKVMLSDHRRQRREQIDFELNSAQTAAQEPEWDRLRPVLDEAIDELPERDRQVVVMRFLELRSFKEIGAALKISADAARVRTDRALEKLRDRLTRRGITSVATALGTTISGHASVSAPAGLAAAIASKSLAVIAGAGGNVAAVHALFSAKIIATLTASVLIAFVVGAYFGGARRDSALPAPNPVVHSALIEENQRLKTELQRLASELDETKTQNAGLLAERARLAEPRTGRIIGAPLPPYAIKESVTQNFARIMGARDQFQLETGRAPTSLEEIVGERNYIKRLVPVDGEDYRLLSLQPGVNFVLTTASGVTVGYMGDPPAPRLPDSILNSDLPPELARARELEKKVAPSRQTALEAYRMANRGKDPPGDASLIAFFTTPQEGADFAEYLEAKKAAGL